ncbi:hypothetical protein WJX84_002229 [Apatococcus fuscideae]|uniref:Ubiquitin carboxyl-terminal hydrolase 7 ICP0-binding domain-containing protein n=1 Tax=Apatococcus fuscideae TaxID=2026836 RepID=A0AAW1T3L3_9CHLO
MTRSLRSCGVLLRDRATSLLKIKLDAQLPAGISGIKEARGVEQDAKRWLLVNVVTHQDLVTHTATEHFDLMNPDKCKQLRVKKTVKIKGFKLQINAELQIPVRSQRLWLWTWRENKSYRLARPLTADEANKKLMGDLVPGGEVADSQRPLLGHGSDHLDLFLETPVFLGSGLPPRAKGNIMLFCKFFDHQQQKLRYVGHIDANKNMTIAVPKEAESNFQFPHVPSFLKHLKECIMVNFVRLDEASRSNVQPLQLELLPSSSYKQICNALAKALQLDDWRRLRFTQQMFHGRPQPRDQPLKFNGLARLSLMLKYFNHTCTTLYYEILGQPLNDIENQDRQVQSALPHLQPADPGSMPLAQQPDDHPPRSPSRRVDRNVQDTTAKKPSSRSDTGGAVPSQPQPERSKPLKTTPKQLPLKRAAAETSQGQRSTSPRKRRKEPTVECVCCKQAGQSAQFPSELELNQHQLSDEHLQAIRDMLREHYGVRTIDASERSTALKPSKKPHARVTLPSMCICRPCNKPSYMGFFDFMLHSLKRNHLDNVQEKVASALRDMALSARKTPEQAPTTLTALPGPEPVPAQDSRLPGPPLRTSSGTMMREQGVPQETRWERTGLAMLPGDTGMDIEEGELTRPATAASPRTSEGGSRVHHPAPSHAPVGTPRGTSSEALHPLMQAFPADLPQKVPAEWGGQQKQESLFSTTTAGVLVPSSTESDLTLTGIVSPFSAPAVSSAALTSFLQSAQPAVVDAAAVLPSNMSPNGPIPGTSFALAAPTLPSPMLHSTQAAALNLECQPPILAPLQPAKVGNHSQLTSELPGTPVTRTGPKSLHAAGPTDAAQSSEPAPVPQPSTGVVVPEPADAAAHGVTSSTAAASGTPDGPSNGSRARLLSVYEDRGPRQAVSTALQQCRTSASNSIKPLRTGHLMNVEALPAKTNLKPSRGRVAAKEGLHARQPLPHLGGPKLASNIAALPHAGPSSVVADGSNVGDPGVTQGVDTNGDGKAPARQPLADTAEMGLKKTAAANESQPIQVESLKFPAAKGGKRGGRQVARAAAWRQTSSPPARALNGGVKKPKAAGVYASPSKAARRNRQQDLLQANIAEQHQLMIAAQQAQQAQDLSSGQPPLTTGSRGDIQAYHPPSSFPAQSLWPGLMQLLVLTLRGRNQQA